MLVSLSELLPQLSLLVLFVVTLINVYLLVAAASGLAARFAMRFSRFVQRSLDADLGGVGMASQADEGETVTTHVVRRKVLVQGDGLHPIPREAVSEEQYTDDEGNIVTRKVTRKLVGTMNRADGVEGEEVVAQALRVDSHSEHLWEGNTMMSNDEKNMNNWIPDLTEKPIKQKQVTHVKKPEMHYGDHKAIGNEDRTKKGISRNNGTQH